MSIQLPDFSTAKVLVVGDLMLDRYWHGETNRVSPEAPVPVVRVTETMNRAGGAANVAANLKSLGVTVGLLGILGNDEAGSHLTELMEKSKIELFGVVVENEKTITKLRVLSRGQQLVRLDFEAPNGISAKDAIKQHFSKIVAEYPLVIFSDYAKGALDNISELIAIAKKADSFVLIDPKGTDFDKYQGADLLTPNNSEFLAVVGQPANEEEYLNKAKILREQLGLQQLIITRSEKGMLLTTQDQTLQFKARAKEVSDVTGAGDTAIATIAASIAAGAEVIDAIELANYAAGIVVAKVGTSTVTEAELRTSLHQAGVGGRARIPKQELREIINLLQSDNKKVVLTNGCFDILHAGHIRFLEEAKAQGDYLIVAVNDDASVKRLKGDERPVNSLEDRMAVLSALAAVNYVLPFSEDTPQKLIAYLLPNTLVKGGDYQIEHIAGGQEVLAAGGEVKVLTYYAGRSTTRIINAIREQ